MKRKGLRGGSHPTAALAREALIGALARRPGARVLDAGCRDALLRRCALAAGASQVVEVRRAELAHAVPTLGRFDIIAANLADPELSALVPALASALEGGGELIATGVQLWQAAALERAFWASGLSYSRPRARGGWACYAAARVQSRRLASP
jgi:ribosomal protein L11 methylase PrmA